MTLTQNHHLDEVLADLVAHHVLEPDQARAVHDAMEPEGLPTAAEVPRPPSPLRARLVEAAAYLGAALVSASVLALVAQSWEDLTETARVLILGGLGLASLVAGALVALLLPGGRAALHTHEHAPRRRVASVLLAGGSVLMAGAMLVQLENSRYVGVVASAVALALMVGAQWLAPSAITELGMFGSSALLVGTTVSLVVPEQVEGQMINDEWVRPPARAWDYLLPIALVVLGLLWAGLVSRLLTLPVLATVVGLLLTLQFAVPLAAEEQTRAGGIAVLITLAAIGIAAFVALRTWPWLVLSVLSLTAVVFILVAAAGSPVMAFLISGLALLGGAALAARLTRRAPAALAPVPEATSRAE